MQLKFQVFQIGLSLYKIISKCRIYAFLSALLHIMVLHLNPCWWLLSVFYSYLKYFYLTVRLNVFILSFVVLCHSWCFNYLNCIFLLVLFVICIVCCCYYYYDYQYYYQYLQYNYHCAYCYNSLALSETYICLSGQFKCTRRQKCIPLNLRCNGQDDCGDGEDETDCRKNATPDPFETLCFGTVFTEL